jgi:hypothetical protein
MGLPVPVPVLVVAVAMIALAVLAIRNDRRLRRAQAAQLSGMGFQPVKEVEPGPAQALLSLYRRGHNARKALRLRRVSRCASGDGELYVLDVLDPTARRGGTLADQVVALVRPGLGLPRFQVFGSVAMETAPGRTLMNLVVTKLGDGQPVGLEEVPGFGQRYRVVAPEGEEAAVRHRLTPAFQQELLGLHLSTLVAGGDALALQVDPNARQNRGREGTLLRQAVDDVLRLEPLLSPGSAARDLGS